MTGAAPRPERFGRVFRVRSSREFQHVYGGRHRRESGPLLVYGRPNGLGHPRLGLSVSRKVGNAVRRNRIKRRLREAFRRLKVELDDAFDFVIVVRPHRDGGSEDYARHLRIAMERVVEGWTRGPEKP